MLALRRLAALALRSVAALEVPSAAHAAAAAACRSSSPSSSPSAELHALMSSPWFVSKVAGGVAFRSGERGGVAAAGGVDSPSLSRKLSRPLTCCTASPMAAPARGRPGCQAREKKRGGGRVVVGCVMARTDPVGERRAAVLLLELAPLAAPCLHGELERRRREATRVRLAHLCGVRGPGVRRGPGWVRHGAVPGRKGNACCALAASRTPPSAQPCQIPAVIPQRIERPKVALMQTRPAGVWLWA